MQRTGQTRNGGIFRQLVAHEVKGKLDVWNTMLLVVENPGDNTQAKEVR
jgi:hypothetical protein